ncbi:MAG: acyl-CoA dehydrogenase family protein [Pseudomonadales bacterium]
MVDFTLTEQQLEWQQKAREFGANELRPLAMQRDQNPDPEQAFDVELYQKGLALGLQKTCIPKKFDGLGLDCLTHTLIWEELGAAEAGFAVSMQAQAWAITMLLNMGTQQQCETWLKPIVDGGLAVISAVEPETGAAVPMYDPMNFAFKTTAHRDGDDWVLNGYKTFAGNAGTPLTSWLYILARTDDKQTGMPAHSFFLVEPDNPGLKVGNNMDKMGHRTAHTPPLTLVDLRVPSSALVGGVTGMPQPPGARQSTADSFLVVGAIGLGIARALYEEALKFTQQRQAAGKPMIQHQMITARLADMYIAIEGARALLWKAAWFTDNNPQSDTKLSLAAKVTCTDAAARISRDALQLFGGYGYTKEALIEKLYRDAKAPEWYEGANESLRIALGQYIDWGV